MKFVALIFCLLAFEQVFASGPDVITEAIIYSDRACSDGSQGCFVLCYKADTAYGENSKCSKPSTMSTEIQKKISVVTKIFDEAKNSNNGKLSFDLENLYNKGEVIPKNFTPIEFLYAIEREDKLKKKENQKNLQWPIEPEKIILGESSVGSGVR
ncbi:MAG: hypothetical protein ACXVCP_07500 [Bdellovibrio sp.]